METGLAAQYDFAKELRFPFGNHCGRGYKYSHKSFHLRCAFFKKGAFTVMIPIGDRQVHAFEKTIAPLTSKAQELWAKRYPCGEQGGWIQDRILEDADLFDVIPFIQAKKAPSKKR